MKSQTIVEHPPQVSVENTSPELVTARLRPRKEREQSLPFGIGCFHFGIKKKPPFELTAYEYLDAIASFLQSIPNVSNIVIDKDLVEDETLEITEETHIREDAFPGLSFLDIEFEIYIPARLQERFSNERHFLQDRPVCEKFRVSIRDAYYCPVTVVEPLEPRRGEDPSSSVIVVREFLAAQSEKSDSELIEFQCLGPSPFHANFYIKSPKKDMEASWLFWTDILDTGSYDEIEIYYDPEAFDNIEEAKDHIFDEIVKELSLFYSLHQTTNRQRSSWFDVKEDFDKIIEIQRRKGLRGSLGRYFSAPKIREAFISIAEFEGNNLFVSKNVEKNYRETYSSENPSLVLKKYLDKLVQSKEEYPSRSLLELANLFEGRREKIIESIIVLASAVLGGVFGALITALLTRP